MKKSLAVMVSMLAVGTSGVAVAAESGLVAAANVTASAGLRHCDSTDTGGCGNHYIQRVNGEASVPIGNNFSVQLDTAFERYTGVDSNQSDHVRGASAYGVHASFRMPDMFLIGAFASHSQQSTYYAGRGTSYGVEAQYYLGPITIYGQLGEADLTNQPASDNNFEGSFGGIEVRYFLKDDIMFHLAAASGRSNDDFEDDGDRGRARSASAGAKMRLMKETPVYLSAVWERGLYRANTEDKGDEDVWMLGVSYLFGASSLKDNDRRGATLSTSLLPSRALGWAEQLD
jgi:hypothetical protein